ncbi:MAG: ATP-binding protein [Allosphingosinicella sp.]|uniref:ATP-binding protein n=1 Tax=Allosphingosinicella sp. TaxID=2823234 RepID=UPI0039446D97
MAKLRRLDWLYIDLPFARAGSANAYLLAVTISGLALLLRLSLDPWLEGIQFITFYPAVLAAALFCGFGAGLFSVLFCTLAVWFFLVEPRGTVGGAAFEQVLALILFVVVAGLTVLVVGAMRVAVRKHRELSRTLRQRIEQRTAELRQAEANLAQSQKMEAVGQLTGGIAHDFNNMLAVVLGNLDMAQRRLGEGRTDVFRQIDNAMDGAKRAAALTQRLLAFARRQPLEPAVVDVNRLLGDTAELLRRTLGEAVRIECALSKDTWRVCADPGQLESAIINLAVNARDAMPDGGTLRIECENRALREEEVAGRPVLRPGDHVLIRVADTGCGMPPDVASRAFEPFFTTKDVGRGTGLGLSQVYGFIRQSGGHVEIHSDEGAGTRILLFLPRHQGEAPSGTGAGAADPVAPRGRAEEVVLAVEDEDQVRRTAVEALTELGYGVREARSGVEALAILANDHSVDLLFTDMVMPGLDGRALVARALRQRPDLRILYTTGYSRENGGGAPTLEGPLLQKPYAYDQLARAIRDALDREAGR